MDLPTQQMYIDRLVENLPVLRKKLSLRQKDLAEIVGVSAYTILAIENRQRKMTWNMFLSLLLVFLRNDKTEDMLVIFEIYTDELMDFIEGKSTGEVEI